MVFVFDRIENNVGKGENDSILTFSHNVFKSFLLQGH